MAIKRPLSLNQRVSIGTLLIGAITALSNFFGPLSGWIPLLRANPATQTGDSATLAPTSPTTSTSNEKNAAAPNVSYLPVDIERYYESLISSAHDDLQSVGKPREESHALQKARKDQKLELIDELLNEKTMTQSPRGSYFFVSGVSCLYFRPTSEEEVFNQERIAQHDSDGWNFEMHRLSDGGFQLAGWISPQEAARLQSEPKGSPLQLSVANIPTGTFCYLALLSCSKITQCDVRNIRTNNRFAYKVADIKLDK